MPTCHHQGISLTWRESSSEQAVAFRFGIVSSARSRVGPQALGWGILVTGSALHGGKRTPTGIWPGPPDLSLLYCPLLPGTEHTWIRTQDRTWLGEHARHVLPAAGYVEQPAMGAFFQCYSQKGDSGGLFALPDTQRVWRPGLGLQPSQHGAHVCPFQSGKGKAPRQTSTQSQVLKIKEDTFYSKN